MISCHDDDGKEYFTIFDNRDIEDKHCHTEEYSTAVVIARCARWGKIPKHYSKYMVESVHRVMYGKKFVAENNGKKDVDNKKIAE